MCITFIQANLKETFDKQELGKYSDYTSRFLNYDVDNSVLS